MEKNSLVFIYNELLSPDVHNNMSIPLEFIAFGTVDAKMYSHFKSNSNFILPLGEDKLWGNTKVYGALFVCRDFDFYINILDAYHACSMDKLRRNHIKDLHHREIVEVTPIHFNTIDELSRLKYREGISIYATTYFGNINHPRIKRRLTKIKPYRIVDGIDVQNYKKLFGRV